MKIECHLGHVKPVYPWLHYCGRTPTWDRNPCNVTLHTQTAHTYSPNGSGGQRKYSPFLNKPDKRPIPMQNHSIAFSRCSQEIYQLHLHLIQTTLVYAINRGEIKHIILDGYESGRTMTLNNDQLRTIRTNVITTAIRRGTMTADTSL